MSIFPVNYEQGEMESSSGSNKDLFPSTGKRIEESVTRLDSGICCSFQSRTDSIRSITESIDSLTARQTNLSHQTEVSKESSLLSLDSGVGSRNMVQEVPSLHQKLQNLHIDEPLKEEPISCGPVLTSAQLQASTKQQKLADLASYDFHTTEEIPAKPENENRCDSGLCESLSTEQERPPHFQQDEDGDTFLHLMIVHGFVDHAVQVIDSCPSWSLLNIQNELGQTALHLAVLMGLHDIARKLLVHGAALEIRDRHGNTPFHLACRLGRMACVLALSRRVRHQETLRVCYPVPFQRIPQAADLQNYDGHTCLKLASLGNHFEVIRHLLIECQANINEADWKSGRSLLHVAAEQNDTDMVEFLLSHPRIKVNAKTYEGHTALKLAQGRCHINVVQLLMLAGAEEEDSAHGSSADEDEEDMNCSSDSDIDDGFDDMEFQGQAIFPR